MRLVLTTLLALGLAAGALAEPPPATGPALGQALASGAVDPAGFDFGALRYVPGKTLGFLSAQSAAQAAVAKAHGKPTWQAVLDAGVCPTASERLTIAGFDSALLSPDAASWAAQKTAAEAAYGRYALARDAILAGQPSPYPEFKSDEATVAVANAAKTPQLKALYMHKAQDQIWRHALAFGAPRAYAEGVGKPGAVWLNARLTTEGCATDAANAAWLKTTLATLPWFDIKTYGKDADAAAWLLAQHADADPELQAVVLDRMGQRALTKDSNPANFAYLWDRVALHSGRPQRYGTQMRCVGRAWAPIPPLEEIAKLDERRSWVGLPPEALYQRTGAKVCGG